MKARKLCVSGWTWLGGCFVLALSVGICYHLAVAAEGQDMGLEVTMSTPRPAILRGEPLVLDIHIRNGGDSALKIYPLNYNLNAVSLRIIVPEGERKVYRPVMSISFFGRHELTLAPREVYTYRTLVLYGLLESERRERTGGHVFPTAGEYSVELTYHPGYRKGLRLEAPPLKVSVQDPQGRDLQAFEIFLAGRVRDFFAQDLSQPPEEFESLAKQYPDTPYGRLAQFYLLRDLSTLLAMQADERHKSLAALEGLARNAEFPLPDEALLHLGLCYACLERKPEAIAAWEEIGRKFRNSPVAPQAAKMLEKLGKKAPAPTTQPATP